MLHALIMAGGSGTRFWPASRDAKPKQLLQLAGPRTMLQATLDRLAGLIPPTNCLIMTNAKLVEAVREQAPELPRDSVLGEPCKRDTAPCVGLAAALLLRRDPDATMLVLPSDHLIQPDHDFQAAIRLGQRLIDERPSRIVTFGIPPTYPAESFGYIERGKAIAAGGQTISAYEVQRFREKPKRETAAEYLASGSFYWNAGIFMWRAATLLDALRKHEPAIAAHVEKIAEAAGTVRFDEVFAREFAAIQGKSIDYAVMERYPEVVVIEAPFHWDDLGSWQALARVRTPDAYGNTTHGPHVGIDTRGSIIETTEGHVIVTIGVDDLIVVHTPDATLVAPKHAEERVREAVQALKEKGLGIHL